MGWFDGFVKWFFNASPVWVDERRILKDSSDLQVPMDRRAALLDRRGSAETHSATTQSTDRRSQQS